MAACTRYHCLLAHGGTSSVSVHFTDTTSNAVLSVPRTGGSATVIAQPSYTLGEGLATDGHYVFFVDGSGVERVTTTGGTPQLLAASVAQYDAFAADGIYVYFAHGTTIERVRSP